MRSFTIYDKDFRQIPATIEDINQIIKKSFGRSFRGNYDIKETDSIDDRMKLEETDGLLLIGKRQYFGLKQEYIAQLGYKEKIFDFGRNPKDIYIKYDIHDFGGSKIAILPGHESEAQKYAELYERKFNKPVEIFKVNRLDTMNKELFAIKTGAIDLNDNMLQFRN